MQFLQGSDQAKDDSASLESGAIKELNENKTDYLLTSTKECWGFYLYSAGSQAYWGAVHVVFIPIIIENITIANLSTLSGTSKCSPSDSKDHCRYKINILNFQIPIEILYLYVYSICVVLQTVVTASIGPIGKFDNLKKKLLAFFGIFGSVSTILFAFIKQTTLWLVAILIVLGAVCYGASQSFHYSYLSILTNNSNKVLTSKALLDSKIITRDQHFGEREQVANRISSSGFGVCYLAMACVLFFSAFIFSDSSPLKNLQYACSFGGLWWLTFTLLSILFLENRNELSFPKDKNYLTYSYKELYKVFKLATNHKNTFVLLLSWLMFNVALNIVSLISVLLTRNEIKMGDTRIMMLLFIATLSSIPGVFVLNIIQSTYRINTKKMLIFCIIFYILLGLYVCIGIFTKEFGYHMQTEAYVVAILYGFLEGASQSFYRAQYNELLPDGKEHEFYTLYVIASYCSLWPGLLLVALLYHFTDNIRLGVAFVSFVFLSSLIFVLFLDTRRGKLLAQRNKLLTY